MKKIKKISPSRTIALGFLALIVLGAILLYLPISHAEGQSLSFVDALFLSASATCVTGLSPVVVADTLNVFGKTVLGTLIQIGGLGVACMGAAFALLLRRRIGMQQNTLLREGWNLSSNSSFKELLKFALGITLLCELSGAVLSFFVFVQKMPIPNAALTALFHSVSAFNNAGFDILGADSLISYRGDVLLTLTTAALIIFGGLGFTVYLDIREKRSLKKLSLHSKIVLFTTAALLILGTLALLLLGDLNLLDSFFFSVSARTAGFMTSPVGELSQASLFVITVLMFIGASPGSTGGGIKTTTFYTLLIIFKGLITGKKHQSFHRSLPKDVTQKALMLFLVALFTLLSATFLLCILEPQIPLMDLVVEATSAAATVGLSTGITPNLCTASKLVLTLVMYIGRLGPLTVATIWTAKTQSNLSYSTESITIG